MKTYEKCRECLNFGTKNCPISFKCLAVDDKPFFKQKSSKKKLIALLKK